jgi:hypothetical protein
MDTKESLQRGEDFQTSWEAHKDAAHDEMIDQATNIILEVEHFVDEISLEVPLRNVIELAEAIKKVANLRYYRFSTTVYGRFRDYEEDFDYDFTEEVSEILIEQLGVDLGLGLGGDS